MDPWKRYRLLACIVVMLGMLVAGIYGRLNPPPPPEPPVSPILDPFPPNVLTESMTNPFVRLEVQVRTYEWRKHFGQGPTGTSH